MRKFIRFIAACVFMLFTFSLITAAIIFLYFNKTTFTGDQLAVAAVGAVVSLIFMISTYVEDWRY